MLTDTSAYTARCKVILLESRVDQQICFGGAGSRLGCPEKPPLTHGVTTSANYQTDMSRAAYISLWGNGTSNHPWAVLLRYDKPNIVVGKFHLPGAVSPK